MDDFAQVREPDDLFSDEIEPTEQAADSEVKNVSTPNTAAIKFHGRNNKDLRGGYRGGHNGPSSSAHIEQAAETEASPVAPKDSNVNNPARANPATNDEGRVISVYGHRSSTAPFKPTKKTEADIVELMKAMQLKNAARSKAHARAEKDRASFLQREQQAAAKRAEVRNAIHEQDMERAKNRERKIKAQRGREWDSEKQESDIMDRSRGGSPMYSRGDSPMYSRGAHGRVRGSGRGGYEDGRTAGSEKVIQELLVAGADVEAVDKDGLTALHNATHFGATKTILSASSAESPRLNMPATQGGTQHGSDQVVTTQTVSAKPWKSIEDQWKVLWEGAKVYEECNGAVGDVLIVSKTNP
jgi:hypothetical protein